MQHIAQLLALVVLLLAWNSSAQNVHYVCPSDCPPQECPEPCMTLDQYVESQEMFFTSNVTFLFLAGNHSLPETIELINISDLMFAGIDSSSDTTILYGDDDAISCINVTNFQVDQLVFVHNTTPTESNRSSALVIFQSRNVSICNSMFKGSDSDSVTTLLFGSLKIESFSIVAIKNCHFHSNSAILGGGISVSASNVILDGCSFIANKATLGGAIYSEFSRITLKEINGITFAGNVAAVSGGAIFCKTSFIEIIASQNERYSVVEELSLSTAYLEPQHVYFVNNSANYFGGAIELIEQSILISDAQFLHFVGNRMPSVGGAIDARNGVNIILGITRNTNHYFTGNQAIYGGALYFDGGSSLIINGSTFFTNNTAVNGGVLNAAFGGGVSMNGWTVFNRNRAVLVGGAVSTIRTPITFSGDLVAFINCSAGHTGGAVAVTNYSLLTIVTTNSNFINNYAPKGGGVYIHRSKFIAVTGSVTFSSNSAPDFGSAIYSFESTEQRLNSAVFTNNSGGTTVTIDRDNNTVYHSIVAHGNVGTIVLHIIGSRINISGHTDISGHLGTGIHVTSSSLLHLLDYTTIKGNMAGSGAAIFAKRSQLYWHGNIVFENNRAVVGGAVYSLESTITLIGTANFTSNSAHRGGAMFFLSSTFNLEPNSTLITSHNHASEYGGVIYHRDTVTAEQCELNMNFSFILPLNITIDPLFLILPRCFLNLGATSIISHNDSATIDGNFLYGGLLDRCRIRGTLVPAVSYQFFRNHFQLLSIETTTDISSKPYQLCFCESDLTLSSCLAEKNIVVHRGQEFNLSLLAYGQGSTPVSTPVTAILQKTASLNLNQSLQTLSRQCSGTTYNLYSTETTETLTLYVDGPCRDTGVATAVVNVILLPCPDAFNKSGDRCVCEARLQVYDAECIIQSEEKIFIQRRTAESVLFWISTLYDDNGSYQGLVLYGRCPPEFCKVELVEILLDNLDSQCNHHRSGKLCGACAANYSLVLGSSRCQLCSNRNLSFLLVFAIAGIVLVVFLTLLRLTVATGMINSIILYANILQVNKSVFFPDTTNALTVFIAWMNLDFGFPVCFYNGMDAYIQTWLQFAFPLYIWVIISMIILLSRYSITISRLIGHNPIAVLATLILMAYTKILKIIIEVYSFVELEYPENKRGTVWLKDANVPYFQGKHLFLTVFTSLLLAFLFIPYTVLLLVGYNLYRFTGRKEFKWLLKVKPLLDSYYAPYTLSTRYWTGFLLLIRCGFYIVFSFNSLGGTANSLLTIILTFSAIVVVANSWLSIKIYKSIFVNIMETSVYMNLIILSAATLADVNSPKLTYCLVSVVFTSTVGIIVYHFHISYTAKSALWLMIEQNVRELKKWITAKRGRASPPPTVTPAVSSHDPHKIVTYSVMSLREPVLEDSNKKSS